MRGAFPDLADPLTPDELAGLSCEDGVESRIVDSRTWKVSYGPHEERAFRQLPKTHWTLLVQEVQRFVPEAASLLDAFSFLPNHRIDDVMVSYAPKGGTVGPHDDSYDVFLIQGLGKRSWRVDARPHRDRTLKKNLELKILRHFETENAWTLERGDMLYLPPGVAHYGVALGDCLTYSVGFRAPNRGELWHELVHDAADEPEASELYRDPGISPARHPGEIDRKSLARVRAMVRSLDLSDAAIDRFFGRFASRLKPDHELEPPRRRLSPEETRRRWLRGDEIVRSEECRFCFLRRPSSLLFYYGGHELETPLRLGPLVELVSERRRFSSSDLPEPLARDAGTARFVATLVNDGAISFGRARS